MESRKLGINMKGYGLVYSKPSDLYRYAEGKNHVVVHDNRENSLYDNAVDTLVDIKHHVEKRRVYMRTGTLLKNLFSIYKRLMNDYKLTDNKSAKKKLSEQTIHQDTKFDCIFVEVGPYVKHTVIYASLLFMCIINMGIEMPEFYLVVNFPTNEFDFMEQYIFNDPVDISTHEIAEKLEQERSLFAVMKEAPRYILFNNDSFDTINRAESLIVITEDKHGWFANISSNINKNMTKFEQISEYRNWLTESRNIRNGSLAVMIVNSPDELIDHDVEVDVIIFDTRVKVEVDLHYLGNVKRSREASSNWYMYNVGLLTKKYQRTKIFLDKTEDRLPIINGTKERSPIYDVYMFKRNNISLLELYKHYYNTSTEYTQAISSSQDTLSRLGYLDDRSPEVRENLHPILSKMMELWVERGYPKHAFLIVIAVITSYNYKYTEIKKTDDQSSRFEDMLEHYLTLMRKSDYTFQNDSYGIGNRLKALCETYMVKGEDEYHKYQIEDIMKSLVELINERFDNYIISLHMDSYRSKYNQNLVWKLSGSSDQVQPKNIFPLVVYSNGRTKRVALYIPVSVN